MSDGSQRVVTSLYSIMFVVGEKKKKHIFLRFLDPSFSIASNVNVSYNQPIDQSVSTFNLHIDKIRLSVWRQRINNILDILHCIHTQTLSIQFITLGKLFYINHPHGYLHRRYRIILR